MKNLAQCKKLIAESEKEIHRPTISHYRDNKNGMLKIQKNGKSKLITNLILVDGKSYGEWQTKFAGSPSNANLEKFVYKLMDSFNKKDGVNYHITKSNNKMFTPSKAQIKNQRSGRIIAEWKAPPFMLINPTTKTTVRKTFVKKTVTKNPSSAILEKVKLRTNNGARPVALESFTLAEQRAILNNPKSFEVDNGYVYLIKKSRNSVTAKKTNPKTIKRKNFTHNDFKAHQKLTLNELARMFQGVANGSKVRIIEPDIAPSNKFRLGYLVQMRVKRNGAIVPIEFDGESLLSADTRRNLWVSGKDSMIKNGLSSIGVKKPNGGQLTIIGDLFQIDYVTAKKHIENGETVRFYHKLGEATGERPKLAVDYDGFPIILGGSYDIWNVGIVN